MTGGRSRCSWIISLPSLCSIVSTNGLIALIATLISVSYSHPAMLQVLARLRSRSSSRFLLPFRPLPSATFSDAAHSSHFLCHVTLFLLNNPSSSTHLQRVQTTQCLSTADRKSECLPQIEDYRECATKNREVRLSLWLLMLTAT